MESIIETFYIDWKVIVAQAINFAIVFVVLYLYALKPLNKIMAERHDKITKGLEDAKTNAKILEDTKMHQEEMLTKARAEAQVIFQSAKKEAEAKKMEIIEEARNEFNTIVANGKKVLESEKLKMLEDAKKELVNLTIASTEKLLSQKLGEHFDRKTIDEINRM